MTTNPTPERPDDDHRALFALAKRVPHFEPGLDEDAVVRTYGPRFAGARHVLVESDDIYDDNGYFRLTYRFLAAPEVDVRAALTRVAERVAADEAEREQLGPYVDRLSVQTLLEECGDLSLPLWEEGLVHLFLPHGVDAGFGADDPLVDLDQEEAP